MDTVITSFHDPCPLPTTKMSYTPKFQSVLDKCLQLNEEEASIEEIQTYFAQAVFDLGPHERLNNLYKIRPKNTVTGQKDRLQFFRMNKMQELIWSKQTNRDLILKMRQGGVTTLSCLIALDKALWEKGSRSAIMADTKDHVKEYFIITKTAFKSFQKDWGHLYPVTEDVDNVNALKVRETGGHLLVCQDAKGLTLDFLHVAEAAFIEDKRISDSIEAVPLSGHVILETTADTASGLFYELWDQTQKDEFSIYTNHFFPWWIRYPEEQDLPYLKSTAEFKYTDKEKMLVELYDLTKEHIIWRRLKISESKGDEGEFTRKYPEDPMTCFLSGTRSVFSAGLLTALWKNERNPAFCGDLLLS